MSTTMITNVKIFDGEKLIGPAAIVFDGGLISDKSTGDNIIDGTGCTLLPGLIDAHAHVDFKEQLKTAAKAGITTIFEMANFSPEILDSLRGCEGVADIIGCYYPATAEQKMNFPAGAIVAGPEDAERYVKEVIALGADFIKIIIEDPANNPVYGTTPKVFTLETVSAIVKLAHKHGKIVVAHVVTPNSYKLGIDAGIDVLTHTPMTAVLSQSIIDEMKENNTFDIPTMVMMEGIAKNVKKINPEALLDFNNVKESVSKMHKTGITILAGTDANEQAQAPYQLSHNSLHNELLYFVEAGFTPVEALRSATSIPAKTFGLNDRGVIKPGKRADLVLVEGDPSLDIRAAKAVKAVWIAGVQVDLNK